MSLPHEEHIRYLYLVTELGSPTQYSKTVSKPSGNKKLLFIFIGQLYPYILPERRGRTTQINNHVIRARPCVTLTNLDCDHSPLWKWSPLTTP